MRWAGPRAEGKQHLVHRPHGRAAGPETTAAKETKGQLTCVGMENLGSPVVGRRRRRQPPSRSPILPHIHQQRTDTQNTSVSLTNR